MIRATNNKNRNKRAALAVGLLLLASSTLSVAASPNYPSSDWIVRSIAEKGKSGLSYCSMNAQYSSGQKLFIARDAGGVNTVAIDFQKPLMEVGRQYVVFTKSGQMAKQYTAIAATTQVLIMKLGTENELLDAMVGNRVASFRVGADNMVFNFGENIIDALNALTDCSAAVASGAKYEGRRIAKSLAAKTELDGDGKVTPPDKDFSSQMAGDGDGEQKQMKLAIQAAPPGNAAVAEMTSRIIGDKKIKRPVRKNAIISGGNDTEVVGLPLSKENVTADYQEAEASVKKQVPAVVEAEEEPKIIVIKNEEDIKEKKRIKEETEKLKHEVAKLKAANEGLADTNVAIREELELQKLKSDNSKHIVDKTKRELLSEINSLKSEQGKLVMQDFQIQKESQEILLDTQKRQREIIDEIKRLKNENDKLKHSTSKEKEASLVLIEKNQLEMENLREENRKLSLQNELENEKRKKQELENTLEQNRIRSELLKMQAENTQLAMEFETGRADTAEQTNMLRQQNMNIANEARAGIEDNKNLTVFAYDKQQKILAETERLRTENDRLKELAEREKAETMKLTEESQEKQKAIEDEIARIKQQNDEMMEKIKTVKTQTQVMQQAASVADNAPLPLVYDGSAKLNVPQVEEDNLKKWLYTSGAAGSSYIEVKKNDKTSEKIYSWKDNSIYGFAKELPDVKAAGINAVVDDYFKRMSGNCKGDFAKTSGGVQMVSYYEVLEAETACMGAKKSSAAVVLFVVGHDKINIITQETAPGNIEMALENRDRILAAIE